MKNILARSILLISALVIGAATQAAVKPDQLEKMKAATPEKAPATPQKARKVLIFTLAKGFKHSTIPMAAEAIKYAGEKTKAYESLITDDPSVFTADKLKEFDAICWDQCTGDPLTTPEAKAALIDFVKSGKGLIGIHAATDCFYNWKEFGDMMGGYFAGHPFRKISVKLDDPNSPVMAMFAGKGFQISDEIYTFKKPYSRDNLHILMSIDWDNAGITQGMNRADNDYALAWIREYGQGRVFYCGFGHDDQIWWNPQILAHYLAGVQYALGDLKADATPSSKISPAIEPARGPKLAAPAPKK
jgi:type 1 glutamine amidotransferase